VVHPFLGIVATVTRECVGREDEGGAAVAGTAEVTDPEQGRRRRIPTDQETTKRAQTQVTGK